MNEFSKYVGLDVHKKTIAVAVAKAGRGAPEYLIWIASQIFVSKGFFLAQILP